jgi:signal transduction histidine kinase
MPEGGTVTVTTEEITKGKISFIRIIFMDTGCGIDSDKLKTIFKAFFTTKEVGKGTGLGLSTSKGIIGNHGGTMEVESEVGKGAAFIIDLPVEMQSE